MNPELTSQDSPLGSATRFLLELLAWVAAPWAIWGRSAGVAIAVAILLVTVPAVFSTPGDKNQVVIPTPGPARLAIEALLAAVAVVGAWVAWSPVAGVAVLVLAAVSIVAQRRRLAWLSRAGLA